MNSTLANTIWYFLIAEVMQLGQIRHEANITAEVKDGSIRLELDRALEIISGFGKARQVA